MNLQDQFDIVLCLSAFSSIATVSGVFLWTLFTASRCKDVTSFNHGSSSFRQKVKPRRMDQTINRRLKHATIRIADILLAAKGSNNDIHTTFTIEISWVNESHLVRKRYSDFVHLATQLKLLVPFVPNLPPKSFLWQHDAAFLEKRRQGLEHFLRRLTVDQYTSELACVRDFVQVP